jgi:hypothetical protein
VRLPSASLLLSASEIPLRGDMFFVLRLAANAAPSRMLIRIGSRQRRNAQAYQAATERPLEWSIARMLIDVPAVSKLPDCISPILVKHFRVCMDYARRRVAD